MRADTAPRPAESVAALRIVRVLAAIGVALMFVVVAASAYLRLARAGAACPDWPACAPVAADLGVTIARTAHRLAAGSVAVLLIALIVVTSSQRPRLAGQLRLASAGLVIALGLALLGTLTSRVAPGDAQAAIVLGNLGGGFALLALMVVSWAAAGTPVRDAASAPLPARVRALYALAFAVTVLVVLLGAVASTGVAQSLHRIGGWIVVAMIAWLLLALRDAPAVSVRWRALLVLAWIAVPALGVIEAYVAPSLAIALAHNLASAAALGVLAAGLHEVVMRGASRTTGNGSPSARRIPA